MQDDSVANWGQHAIMMGQVTVARAVLPCSFKAASNIWWGQWSWLETALCQHAVMLSRNTGNQSAVYNPFSIAAHESQPNQMLQQTLASTPSKSRTDARRRSESSRAS